MEIKKGNRFVCTKDVIMEGSRQVNYVKGDVYTSEQDGCITNMLGETWHSWTNPECQNFLIPYSKLDRVYTKATERLKSLHGTYDDGITFFDNCNSSLQTGWFCATNTIEEYYNDEKYTYLSEQAFIEFMGLSETTDAVNKPSHYNNGSIDPIDYITANSMNFLEGNVVKYVTRYKFKNGLEDLKKAEFYLKRLIEEYK